MEECDESHSSSEIIARDDVIKLDEDEEEMNSADDESILSSSWLEGQNRRELRKDKSRHTLQKTQRDVGRFRAYVVGQNEDRPLEKIPGNLMCELLKNFIRDVKRKDGSEYEPDSISSIVSSVDRYLRQLGYSHSIMSSAIFRDMREMIRTKRKELKSAGKGAKVNSCHVLSTKHIKQLWETGSFGVQDPVALLNATWFVMAQHFGYRSNMECRNICYGDITEHQDNQGTTYLELKPRSTTSSNYRSYHPRMWATGGDRCPVHVLREYERRKPERMKAAGSPFFLAINHRRLPSNRVWYKCAPLGIHMLGKIMRKAAKSAGLAGRFTNCALRKSSVPMLLSAGLSPVIVAQHSGYKTMDSLRNITRASLNEQRELSDILAYQTSLEQPLSEWRGGDGAGEEGMKMVFTEEPSATVDQTEQESYVEPEEQMLIEDIPKHTTFSSIHRRASVARARRWQISQNGKDSDFLEHQRHHSAEYRKISRPMTQVQRAAYNAKRRKSMPNWRSRQLGGIKAYPRRQFSKNIAVEYEYDDDISPLEPTLVPKEEFALSNERDSRLENNQAGDQGQYSSLGCLGVLADVKTELEPPPSPVHLDRNREVVDDNLNSDFTDTHTDTDTSLCLSTTSSCGETDPPKSSTPPSISCTASAGNTLNEATLIKPIVIQPSSSGLQTSVSTVERSGVQPSPVTGGHTKSKPSTSTKVNPATSATASSPSQSVKERVEGRDCTVKSVETSSGSVEPCPKEMSTLVVKVPKGFSGPLTLKFANNKAAENTCDLGKISSVWSAGEKNQDTAEMPSTDLASVSYDGYFVLPSKEFNLVLVKLYNTNNPRVKWTILIDRQGKATIKVHRRTLSDKHIIWMGLGDEFHTASDVMVLLKRLEYFGVCPGTPSGLYQHSEALQSDMDKAQKLRAKAYIENDSEVISPNGCVWYNSILRTTDCALLVKPDEICFPCMSYRYSQK